MDKIFLVKEGVVEVRKCITVKDFKKESNQPAEDLKQDDHDRTLITMNPGQFLGNEDFMTNLKRTYSARYPSGEGFLYVVDVKYILDNAALKSEFVRKGRILRNRLTTIFAATLSEE